MCQHFQLFRCFTVVSHYNVQCSRTRFKSSFSVMEPLNKRRSNDGVTEMVANVSTLIIMIEFRIFL